MPRTPLLLFLLLFAYSHCFSQTWQSQYNSLLNTYNAADFSGVLDSGQACLNSAEKEYGKKTKAYVYTLKLITNSCYNLGQYRKGIEFGLAETNLVGSVADSTSLDYANSFHTLALNYQGAKESDSALLNFKIVEKIYRSDTGRNAEVYGNILDEMGLLYYSTGNYDSAGNYFDRSLKVYESLENLPANYLTTLRNAGNLNLKQLKYDQALQKANRLISILRDNGMTKEKIFGEALLITAVAYNGLSEPDQSIKAFLDYTAFLSSMNEVSGPEYSDAINQLAKLYKNTGNISAYDSLLTANKNILAASQTETGSNLTDYANLAVIYQNKREFDKAEKTYKDAFDLIDAGGVNDPVGEGLLFENYALLLYSRHNYHEAAESIDKTIHIFNNDSIKIHYLIAAYNTKGLILKAAGDYDTSAVYLTKASDLCTVNNMYNSDLHAKVLENLSALNLETGKNTLADSCIQQALTIRKELNEGNSAAYANTLNSYGAILDLNGKFPEAISSLKEALGIINNSDIKDPALYSHVITNLGLINMNIGNAATADSLFTESVAQSINEFGDSSSEAGEAYLNLARSKQGMGNYNAAEKNYRAAQKILGTDENRDSKNYQNCVNSFGVFYQKLGNYSEAEKLYKENMDNLSHQDPLYSVTLQNLATLNQLQEKYDVAEPLLIEAVRRDSISKGINDPDYAVSLQNLASLYQKTGRTDKAEALFLEALKIDENTYGKIHPSYARKLFNLATLYQDEGKFDKALPLMKESVEIRKSVFGTEHPDYAYGQFGLAVINDALGNESDARISYNEALRIYLKELKDLFPAMSEKEKTAFYNKLRPIIDDYFDFGVDYAGTDSSILSDLYNLRLKTKAILLNTSSKIRYRILTSGDQDLIDRFNQWVSLKEQLVRMYSYSKKELASQGLNVNTVQEEANDVEKELSARSELFSQGRDSTEVTWRDIQSALTPDEAAIEIIRIKKNIRNDSVIYAGLIVDHNTINHPDLVIIPDGLNMESREFNRYINTVKYKISNKTSYNIFWKPFDKYLSGIKTVYISLDGVYNKISLNTLYDSLDGKYVIDKYQLVVVSNTKDLVKSDTSGISKKNETAELLGYPDYRMGLLADNRSSGEPATSRGLSEIFQTGIGSLPGTKQEVESIDALLDSAHWNATLLTGDNATENNIKKINRPGILHLATHGFFLNDIKVERNLNENNNLLNEALEQNPLMRSGILLAGAEAGISEGASNAININNTDGILTAYEAMNLNLENTRLVVLSACETGLGEIQNGEGIYGLQRAFIVAGASNLIMSLWKVDDNSTQELMTAFYEKWLEGENLHTAFREAQIQLKNKYSDPFYWGAFVMIGK